MKVMQLALVTLGPKEVMRDPKITVNLSLTQ